MLASAEAHYAQQAALAALVARRVRALWSRVDRADFDAWRALVPAAVTLVSAAQLAAVRSAEPYVAGALVEQGAPVAPDGSVVPGAFVGAAADGRALGTLLDEPRITALTRVKEGWAPLAALTSAGGQLVMLAVTQVQDAGRAADQVAILSRPRVGWVRMVNPPCCELCAIQAGRWFRANQGFARHPRCDCRHIPALEDAPANVGTSPRALFASGQVRGVRKVEAQAIADGADPVAVINARRGRSRTGMTTTEGTTRRGVAGAALRAGGRTRVVRATPDAIYQRASSRQEALDLLEQHGYLR